MLQLDYRSGESLYVQIKENFKRLILSKSLKEDELLPSVRALASSLAINVNTVQRAYRELEQEGYIYSIPGKGNFVAGKIEDAKQKSVSEIREELSKIVEKARAFGVEQEEFQEMIKEFYNKGGKQS
ncbi:MAG: GntR family transcriptional regulator [Clostridia bacterium]|nr:GntR family transcriptional regulator [Clostridia bacterium]